MTAIPAFINAGIWWACLAPFLARVVAAAYLHRASAILFVVLFFLSLFAFRLFQFGCDRLREADEQ